MRKTIKRSTFLMLCCFTSVAVAAGEASCIPLPLKNQNKTITLPGVDGKDAKQIYFLKNISSESLWIDHPREPNRTANAGWSSYLRPGLWSAILIDRKNFVLNCAVIQPGKVDTRTCAKSITVCTLPKATLGAKRKGSYWLAEDQPWEELLVSAEKRGVKFK